MRHLHQLSSQIESWAIAEPRVRALMWYGQRAHGTFTPFSDIDAAIVHVGTMDETVESLVLHLGARVRECARIDARGEVVLWVDEALVKIDLRLVGSPEELRTMARSLDVPAPRFAVAVDKDARCAALAREASAAPHRDLSSTVDEEIEKFLIGFEAASNAHRRSDGYRFYFEYNLALHRLARLVEIARGNGEYLFLPRMLLSRCLSQEEQREFRALSGTLYLPEAAERKRRLRVLFLMVARELARRYSIRRTVPALAQFLSAVENRDAFHNARDIAVAYPGLVRPGRLFRASTLSRWSGTPDLAAWLKRHRVSLVVDFRDPLEAAARLPYPSDTIHGVPIICLPLSGTPGGPVETDQALGQSYFRQLLEHLDNVVSALRRLADPRNESVVVHCHAGRDRTGWFCAIVAALLGADEASIVEDYMLTGQDTREESIQAFLALVSNAGGIQEILRQRGYGPSDVEALRGCLLAEAVQ